MNKKYAYFDQLFSFGSNTLSGICHMKIAPSVPTEINVF